ncbi:MAG: 4Fe-4S binding protein [Candidatus Izemoplasmatales bacterium]|jgi:dihydroorotate dehydrogenase (fumarate)|nr:4Fe-4S binding protein [Candidatus Izemoplasmatales bacterium]
MNLQTTFDGITLKNPLMPASGPLVGDAKKLEFMIHQDCGAVVTKTISTKEPHIPKPCIYGDKEFVMNSELWSEYSYLTWVNEFLPSFQKIKDRPLIISVGYSKEDMEVLIPLLEPFADMFEVSTHYVGKDLNVIKDTVLTIKKYTKKPLYMKISPHIPNPEEFARVIYDAGASGIVAINSLGPSLKIDIASRKIVYGSDSGFVWTSGPSIKPIALATIYKIKSAVPELTIIGVGGIKSADDVIEFMLAGASAVQMLSGALLKGKDLYSKIILDLPATLEKYGFSSIEEVKKTKLNKDVEYVGNVPTLNEDKCIKCMLCMNICPYFAIDFTDKITFNKDMCFRCGLCISKCPVKAINSK